MANTHKMVLWLAAMALAGCAAPSRPATAPVGEPLSPPQDLVEQVDQTLIVWARPDTSGQPGGGGGFDAKKWDGLASEFAGATESDLVAVYPHLRAFSLRSSDPARVREISSQPRWDNLLDVGGDLLVSLVDGPSCTAPASLPQPPVVPLGVERVGGPFSGGYAGKRVWVIDTGLDLVTADGQIVVDRQIAADCTVPAGSSAASPCVSGPAADLTDSVGHGTMLAGIIAAQPRGDSGLYGVAPGATVVPIKVFGTDVFADFAEGPMRGIDYVAALASPGDVVNISWGGEWNRDLKTFLVTYSGVNRALRRLAKDGVRIAIAAGNNRNWVQLVAPAGAGGYRAPSSDGVVMTASAVGSSKYAWLFWEDSFWGASNYGRGTPDFAEPGVDVMSLWPGNMVRSCSGTSFAAPHLAGILLRGLPRPDGYAKGDPDKLARNSKEDTVGVCCAP